MKTVKTIVNVLGLLMGIVFLLVSGGSDIQLGFGAVLLLISVNNLL